MRPVVGASRCPTSEHVRSAQRFDVPTLVAHGDDDRIVPIGAGPKSAKLIRDATLKVYPGSPHGLVGAHEDEFNTGLPALITS
ncbi:alpha/beta fold hydrolase [Streptosporangium sp. NPDC023615]|uniref:alpha/beta fold hydrolase n=1 Tax=Streptosporangium sp. NPDC023615 TaxID=3154794 RepID=UPI00344691F8